MRSKTKLLPAALLLTAVAAGPASAVPLTLQTLIPIPATAANIQPGGTFTSFDISYYNPATGIVYIADRSNASVDLVSTVTRTVVGQATGFTGQKATTSVSGADGVVAVTSGGTTTLYAGDGNSTLKVFNVTNPAAPVLTQSISTGGSFRVDEMAYSPTAHQLLVANNADSPAFATLFSTAASPITIAHTGISIPGALGNDGLEQPVWNPGTNSFFVSVPAFAGDKGGVAEINTDGTVGRLYKFASMAGVAGGCGASGLAVGASGNLLVGCGDKTGGAAAVLLNPTGTGSIVATYAGVNHTDEIWYDGGTNNYYVTGADPSGHRIFAVINDASHLLTESVLLPVADAANPHSIAVDGNGNVYVPLAGSTAAAPDGTCPLGCVAVFGVPEPGSLPMLLTGAAALMGFGVRRSRAKV